MSNVAGLFRSVVLYFDDSKDKSVRFVKRCENLRFGNGDSRCVGCFSLHLNKQQPVILSDLWIRCHSPDFRVASLSVLVQGSSLCLHNGSHREFINPLTFRLRDLNGRNSFCSCNWSNNPCGMTRAPPMTDGGIGETLSSCSSSAIRRLSRSSKVIGALTRSCRVDFRHRSSGFLLSVSSRLPGCPNN